MDRLETLQKMQREALAALTPPPDLTVSEWADAHRALSSESSAEPGIWRTDRAPYQRGIMDAFTDEGIHTVVVMSSAQVGKSEFLLNAIGYYASQDPAPLLMLQPTLQMGEAFSKDRVAPMFRDTPTLRHLIGEVRTKDSANTLLHKKFPGGHLTIAGANSAAGLASRPIRIVLADEVDRYPVSAGSEGDPLNLAKKRTATFHNRKIALTSTPTVKGASRIEMAYQESDQRRYYVPCLSCGTYQPLEWQNLRWEKGAEDRPWYECDHCGGQHTERDKMPMLRGGRWVAEAVAPGVAGFHLNELYSPWRKWSEMVFDFLEAKKDSELLRVFVNTSLGETFEEEGDGVEPSGLYARREHYGAEVPSGGLVLVAGVDVQDEYLVCQVRAYGHGEESWSIANRVIHGDPGRDKVWADLDDIILNGRWRHEGGQDLRVAATCIDSGGHHTQRVYDYVRTRKQSRVFAIKGMAGFGRPMVSAPSPKRHGRERRKADLFTLGVDEIKSLIYTRLGQAEPGAGYLHFPITDEFGEEFFAQLGAEQVRTKFVRGVPRREWVQIRKRNEALDTTVYAHAAVILLNPNYSAIEERLGERPTRQEPVAKEQGLRQNRRPARKKGFVNGWR